MLKKVLALVAAMMLLVAFGCSSTTSPVVPDKDGMNTPEEYFNQFDLSNPVVGEFTYSDLEGNVLSYGQLGRNDDNSFYIIDQRGAQIDFDVTPLGLVLAFVTYNNPAGTIPTGPNAGLPYYYLGQTVDYDINLVSLFYQAIGSDAYPAEVKAEMHFASWDTNGEIVVGGLMVGDPTYTWYGIITPGYNVLNDTYYIAPGNTPGLNVTTVKISAPVFFGMIDVIFFDGVAGIWDPQ
jgi:hypothetical protein